MTDQEIRIAIAEACGVKYPYQLYGKPEKVVFFDDCPDYPNDLNAMHEAWNTLSNDNKIICAQWIMKLGNINSDFKADLALVLAIDYFNRYFCQAFVRTVGKWKD